MVVQPLNHIAMIHEVERTSVRMFIRSSAWTAAVAGDRCFDMANRESLVYVLAE